MLDNLNPRDDAFDGRRERPRRAPEQSQPLADREVPLGSSAATDTVNQWLDGELPESAVGNPRRVALWNRINAEAAERRELSAPVGLSERIMEALPAVEPELAVQAPATWWNKPIEITPAIAVAAAAGLLVIGAAINASFRVR